MSIRAEMRSLRPRSGVRSRVRRVRERGVRILTAAFGAALAWWLARDLLGHPQPFFAPVTVLVTLGLSYGQRLRRVTELVVGVAVGVLVGDTRVAGLADDPPPAGEPASATFAPEAVAVHVDPPGGSPRTVLAGLVLSLEPVGSVLRLRTDTFVGVVLADLTPAAVADLDLAPGAEVHLAVPAGVETLDAGVGLLEALHLRGAEGLPRLRPVRRGHPTGALHSVADDGRPVGQDRHRIRSLDAAALTAALERLGIRGVPVREDAREGIPAEAVVDVGGEKQAQRLLADLVGADARVVSFSPASGRLETAYLSSHAAQRKGAL